MKPCQYQNYNKHRSIAVIWETFIALCLLPVCTVIIKIVKMSRKSHNHRTQPTNDTKSKSTHPAGTWRLYNVGSTSMQRHDVASTLRQLCINIMCLLDRQWQTVHRPQNKEKQSNQQPAETFSRKTVQRRFKKLKWTITKHYSHEASKEEEIRKK